MKLFNIVNSRLDCEKAVKTNLKNQNDNLQHVYVKVTINNERRLFFALIIEERHRFVKISDLSVLTDDKNSIFEI